MDDKEIADIFDTEVSVMLRGLCEHAQANGISLADWMSFYKPVKKALFAAMEFAWEECQKFNWNNGAGEE